MSEIEVWIDDQRGNRLKLIEKIADLSATRIANGQGWLSMTTGPEYDAYIRLDAMIEIWRAPAGGALKLFNVYKLRRWSFVDDNNIDLTEWGGPDGHDLLRTRIVAYAAGTTNAEQTTYADDMLKSIVRDNLTTDATDTDRDLSGLNVTVSANLAAAPSITLGFSRRNLVDVADDIVEASRKNGTNLYYSFQPVVQSDGTLGFDFRTYTGQPGRDLTDNNQVVFGRSYGNMTGAQDVYDYTDEVTVVYAGGRGTDSNRVVEEVEDTTRSAMSVWNRREAFLNVSGNASTTDAYVAAGQARLSELRPGRRFTATLIDTQQAAYQRDWDWGDRVILTYRGREYEAIITGIHLSFSGGGKETIRAVFEVQ